MSAWLVLHQLSMAFVTGGFLALVAATSLLARSIDDTERKHQARLVAGLARFVAPFMDAGVTLGLVHWLVAYTPYGFGKLMACSPPYLHIMVFGGFVTLGLGHAFRAKARRLSEAAEAGDQPRAKQLAGKAFLFGVITLGLLAAITVTAVLKVPSGQMLRCVP